MVDNKELFDEKIDKLMKKNTELLKLNIISSSALQLKITEDIIEKKIENENSSLEYAINSINKNVLKNSKKYSSVFERKEDLLSRYKDILVSASKYYDNSIFNERIKIFKEELLQVEQHKKLIILKKKESKAKEKLDNSDDVIAEDIYALEDEIAKSETKVKRTKTLLRNKIKEKEICLFSAIESKDKELQREIKGPKVIKNATRFFMGKLNPTKMIEKNVFSGFENRITDYLKESEEILSKKLKYDEDNILKTINDMVLKSEKKVSKIN